MSVKIEVLKAYEPWQSWRKKVGVHRRKTEGKTYESPRIVLPGGFKEFIGKEFIPYVGEVRVTHHPGSRFQYVKEGEALILVFPKEWGEGGHNRQEF